MTGSPAIGSEQRQKKKRTALRAARFLFYCPGTEYCYSPLPDEDEPVAPEGELELEPPVEDDPLLFEPLAPLPVAPEDEEPEPMPEELDPEAPMPEELEPEEPRPEVPLEPLDREDPEDPEASLDPEPELPRLLDEPEDFEDELLPDVEEPSTPNASLVLLSSVPLADSPCCCWKAFNADFVFGPMMPSISPGSWPLSLSACCTFFTSSLPAALLAEWLVEDISDEDPAEEEDDMPVSPDLLPELRLPTDPLVPP
jgi:hypothetical protein